MSKEKTTNIPIIMGFTENCPIRSDAEGDGSYGAKRGSRKHNGIDLKCRPGSTVLSPVTGTVTKLGYPYLNGRGGFNDGEGAYRYVQVSTDRGTPDVKNHRMFYVEPSVKLGDRVRAGQIIGSAQDVPRRYDELDDDGSVLNASVMQTHVHYEIMSKGRTFEDPEKFTFHRPPTEK